MSGRAKAMFNAYNEQGPNPWRTFDGRQVPAWENLSDQVRAKWEAAAAVDGESIDVLEFMRKFDQLFKDGQGRELAQTPRHLTLRKLRERAKFIQEEFDEFIEAADNQNLPEMADALIDLVYVIKGTAIFMGLPWNELWADVQRANMAKVRGVGKRGNLVDVVKPVGWDPPHTLEVLKSAGYGSTVSSTEARWDDLEHSPGGVVQRSSN